MSNNNSITPLKMLFRTVKENVLVKLKDGSEIVGILERCDTSMNIVLSNAKQVNEDNGELLTNFGSIFIRGSNILFIVVSPSQELYEY